MYVLQTVNACEVCGEVAHDGCARHVPHDCKPVALEASEMVHLWRPAGIAMNAQDVSASFAVTQTMLERSIRSFIVQRPNDMQRPLVA
jgi:hypothetical protein